MTRDPLAPVGRSGEAAGTLGPAEGEHAVTASGRQAPNLSPSDPTPRGISSPTTVSGSGEEALREALTQASEALRYSKPIMAHYPEPLDRHAKAQTAVDAVLALFDTQPPSRSSGGEPWRAVLREARQWVEKNTANVRGLSAEAAAPGEAMLARIDAVLTLPHSDREEEGRDPKGSGHAPEAEPHARLGATPACPSRKPSWRVRAAWIAQQLEFLIHLHDLSIKPSRDENGMGLSHALFMCAELQRADGEIDTDTKACRWLGWLQCLVTAEGVLWHENIKAMCLASGTASLLNFPEGVNHA